MTSAPNGNVEWSCWKVMVLNSGEAAIVVEMFLGKIPVLGSQVDEEEYDSPTHSEEDEFLVLHSRHPQEKSRADIQSIFYKCPFTL